MRPAKLKNIMLIHRFYAILFLALCVSAYGYFMVKRYIVGEAQKQVKNDLRTVRAAYRNQLEKMAIGFNMLDSERDFKKIKDLLGLDYIYALRKEDFKGVKSDVVIKALKEMRALGSTRIMGVDEIKERGGFDGYPYFIDIKETLKSRPTEKKVLEDVMAIEYARPFFGPGGGIHSVIYGGKIINRNNELIDEIIDSVFEEKMYGSKPVGTVTLFQDDVRISTNVLDPGGGRALGTRVSDEVYKRVIESGEKWYDRAFVVTDWYITAYEPIMDINGNIIGILYVGILEQPFMDTGRNIFVVFLIIILLTSVLAGGLSVMFAKSIHKPLTEVAGLTKKISEGKWESKIQGKTRIKELNDLIDSFHQMSAELERRENNLALSNRKLEDLNKDYLELVGFVSHELKGVLSSLVINTYLLLEQTMGEINEKQRKTLKSIAKNLDYLASTVRNFLNLSRIEKGELKINKKRLRLKTDVFEEAIEAFSHLADGKNMRMINNIPEALEVSADPEMTQIIANNLLSNAVKYGVPGGGIVVKSKSDNGYTETEVYNDGRPIVQDDTGKLFKKFSRVIYEGMEKVKGSGVGLYISKEIIERHGGRLWVEPREKGNSFFFTIPNGENTEGKK